MRAPSASSRDCRGLAFRVHAVRPFVLLLAVLLCPTAPAQRDPHIGYVYPAGGRQGATFQAVVGGQTLGGSTNVLISGEGITAKVLEYTRPLTQKEFNELREKLAELQEKRRGAADKTGGGTNTWTIDDEKQLADVRKKLANPPNRQANPAIAENVSIEVTVDKEAIVGRRELRLGTGAALSNPLLFYIGELPEYALKPGRVEEPRPAARFFPAPTPRSTDMQITLPATVNGQILPGELARWTFEASRGQHLVIAAKARELIPYLPDAVPGWFQAVLTLRDATGKEVAYNDDFRFDPDPVIYFDAPEAGKYTLEIRDSIYRGREDFVYRICIGEIPFLTSIFPLGGRIGEESEVRMSGWNLAEGSRKIKPAAAGMHLISAGRNGPAFTERVFLADDLPEASESEPNDSTQEAQSCEIPLIMNGRIGAPKDRDVFKIAGKKGQEIVAEVFARRLGSPLDSMLKLLDEKGSQIAANDDWEDKGSGLTTHQADSLLQTVLPADGTYYLQLSDAQGKSGPDYAYRLRISQPMPDFQLRVVPSSINLRAGGSAPLTVYALRRDGFTNEITLALTHAPAGFKLTGGRVPAGQSQIKMTLSAAPLASPGYFDLEMEGIARTAGKELRRAAVPADDLMQAFAYRHLVPARELKVAVGPRLAPRPAVRIVSEMPMKIPTGGTAHVKLATGPKFLPAQVRLELNDPPEGIAIQTATFSDNGADIVIQSDASKTKPGLKGNLIVQAFAGKNASANNAAAQRRGAVGTLPAIPFEVVDP